MRDRRERRERGGGSRFKVSDFRFVYILRQAYKCNKQSLGLDRIVIMSSD